mmetsp:Transcript_137533/g.357373  ORF Transcript_137533/g.357373 Transcript_137533/m.357373 type:complete len:209 (+) Transcript_137533:197-823(+)
MAARQALEQMGGPLQPPWLRRCQSLPNGPTHPRHSLRPTNQSCRCPLPRWPIQPLEVRVQWCAAQCPPPSLHLLPPRQRFGWSLPPDQLRALQQERAPMWPRHRCLLCAQTHGASRHAAAPSGRGSRVGANRATHDASGRKPEVLHRSPRGPWAMALPCLQRASRGSPSRRGRRRSTTMGRSGLQEVRLPSAGRKLSLEHLPRHAWGS